MVQVTHRSYSWSVPDATGIVTIREWYRVRTYTQTRPRPHTRDRFAREKTPDNIIWGLTFKPFSLYVPPEKQSHASCIHPAHQ